VIKLFASPEETDVTDSDNFHSLLLGLVYLEVLTRLHCKEDGKGNKLGGCLFKLQAVSLVDFCDNGERDSCLVSFGWVEILERPKFLL
jgi:hypothetical protein